MVSKTKKIILGAGVTILSILTILLVIPGVIITASGDITCAGTLANPCISYFNITSSQYSIKFYNSTQKLSFNPDIQSYKIYRYMSGKWKESNFPINITKGVLYQFKIEGIKNNPTDTIKWGINAGDANIDPLWMGTNTYDEYSTTTETHCVKGICQLTLYSGVRYAFEDSIWKNITDVRSLKGKEGIDIIVIMDKDFPVEVIDYNYTSITVKLNITSKQTNKDIPLQVYDTFNDSIKFLNTTIKSILSSFNSHILTFGLGKTLKFGFNSTVITLNESNGGNVGDAKVNGATGLTSNYGTTTTLTVGSGSVYYSFLLWNLSLLPAGATITNANMSLNMTIAPTSTRYFVAYNTSVYNSTGAGPWVEGSLNDVTCSGTGCNLNRNITWNNQPSAGTLQDNRTIGTTANVWIYWNVTNAAVSTFANATNKNMSIVLISDGTAARYATFISKEGASVVDRPQLVITYTAGDITPPTYSNIGVNNTNPAILDQVLFYSNWSDNIALNYSIFSWNATGINCDTWANLTEVAFSGTWANYTNQIPATCLGKITGIGWMMYANDSSNNWNNTPATNSFSVGGAPDINYSFGPPSTTMIMFNQPDICDEELDQSFIYPENQTSTMGIFNFTNNGTATATDFRCSLSSPSTGGYAFMLGNTTGNYSVNTTNVSLCFDIAQSAKCQIWSYLNCTYPSTSWHPNLNCYAT